MDRLTPFEYAQKFAKWTVVVAGIAALGEAALALTLPYQVNYAEGPLLGVGIRIANGLDAYPAPTKLPYILNPYGPVPYYLIATLVRIFGVSLTPLRLLVMALTICSALLIALLVQHWTNSLPVGLLFGAVYLSMPTVQTWLATVRVDMFAVALCLAGLYLFVKSSRWYLAVPFFVAALFCKFSYVAAPAACFLYLLSQGEVRKAIGFSALCAAMGGLAFLVCQRASDGWFVFHTILSAKTHPFDLHGAFYFLGWEFLDNLPLVLLMLLVIGLTFKKLPRQILLLPLFYFCITFLTLIARGKAGADSNYYLEWDAALCLMAGLGYAAVCQGARQSRALMAIVPLMLGAVAVSNMSIVQGYRTVHPPNFDDQAFGCRDAYQFVQQHAGTQILSENVGAAILAGKSPVVFEPFLWTHEVTGAGWSSADVVDLIRSRKIDLIALNREAVRSKNLPYEFRWPRPVVAAIDENYKLVNSFDCTDARYMYEPAAPGTTPANPDVAKIIPASISH